MEASLSQVHTMPLLMHAVKFGQNRGDGPPTAHLCMRSGSPRSHMITCSSLRSVPEDVLTFRIETMSVSFIRLRLDRDACRYAGFV